MSSDRIAKQDEVIAAQAAAIAAAATDATTKANAAAAASWPATTAFDATVPAAVGTAATGSAAKAAHRDHVHPTGAGTPSTQAFGDAAATGSGPAAAMTDHKHAMPANPGVDLVQVTSGAGSIIIPGLKGSPDIYVGGTNDDEFDQNTAGVPSGWTSLGTMDTPNTTDARSHLHLRKQTTDTTFAGLYKAIPAARPLTVTAKLSAWGPGLTFHAMGIFVAEASPGKIAMFAVQRFAAATTGAMGGVAGEYSVWTVFGTRASASTVAFPRGTAGPIWVRVVITSDTSIAYQLSPDGLIYNTIASALNPAFTLGQVGVGIAQEGAADANVFVDWIRFT